MMRDNNQFAFENNVVPEIGGSVNKAPQVVEGNKGKKLMIKNIDSLNIDIEAIERETQR